jgi:leucine dehydrogenase
MSDVKNKNANQIIEENQTDFLDYALSHDFGEIHFKVDPKTGMKAMIAIHNTKLGPALGGCRFIEYSSTAEAINDAMRLARGMSYKAASVNLPLGGGKAVIIKPKGAYDRIAYLRAFGQFVNDLGGRYITALDSGTELVDMDIIAEHTPYVASRSIHEGDPSPYTAKGILRGIEAAVQFKLGKNSLKDLHIAIQGLGHVGYLLATHLHALGAKLTVSDINSARTELAKNTLGATVVPTSQIHAVPCDVFSPCALGGIINDTTINELKTTIVAGAANNQLAHSYHGQLLHDKGILYATDYVINAGGLIFAASKYLETSETQANEQSDNISEILLQIFARSRQENRPTSEIADQIAQEKLK